MIVVICMCGDTFQMCAVCCFTPIGQKSEVFQDVVLCVSSHPYSVGSVSMEGWSPPLRLRKGKEQFVDFLSQRIAITRVTQANH